MNNPWPALYGFSEIAYCQHLTRDMSGAVPCRKTSSKNAKMQLSILFVTSASSTSAQAHRLSHLWCRCMHAAGQNGFAFTLIKIALQGL